jgi:hypothetical protein
MNLADLFYIMLLVTLAWYWQDAMRCKEIARDAGKKACMEAGVAFLDDSVAIHKVRLRRNELGQIVFYREYYFEFTSDGSQRTHGEVHIMRRHILEVTLDAYRIGYEDI